MPAEMRDKPTGKHQ